MIKSSQKMIKLIQTHDNIYTVFVGDKIADRLGRDEALGVIASALFSSKPMYVKSFEDFQEYNAKFQDGEKPEWISLIEKRFELWIEQLEADKQVD